MSAPRRSTRKRSSEAVARSQQVTEILTLSEDSQEGEFAHSQQRPVCNIDDDYVPDEYVAGSADSAESEEKSEAGPQRKRRNSGPSAASAEAASSSADSDAKVPEAKAENAANREVGPLSDRARFLPAGTHAAVRAHAQSLFELAIAAENASAARSEAAGSGAVEIAIAVDADAETYDEKEPSTSSASSRSSDASTATAASSSSSSSRSSSDARLPNHVPAAAEVAHDRSSSPALPELASPLSPVLIAEQQDSGLSPFPASGGRIRGLSSTRSPEPLDLPPPMLADRDGSLSARPVAAEGSAADGIDRKHGQPLICDAVEYG